MTSLLQKENDSIFFSAFEKVSSKPFNLNYFLKEYRLEDENLFDFSPFEDIEGILLEDVFIKKEYKGMGYGTQYVEELKRIGKPIILYSLFESEEFWEKQGFKNVIADHVYVWGLM